MAILACGTRGRPSPAARAVRGLDDRQSVHVYAAGWRVLRASAAHVWAYLPLFLALYAASLVLDLLLPVDLAAAVSGVLTLVQIWLFGVMTVVFTASALGRPTPWLLRGVGPGKTFAVLLRLFPVGIACGFVFFVALVVLGSAGLLQIPSPVNLTYFMRLYVFGAFAWPIGLALAMPLALGIPAVTLRENRKDRSVGIRGRWRMQSRMAYRIVVALVPVTVVLVLVSLMNAAALNIAALIEVPAATGAVLSRMSFEQTVVLTIGSLLSVPVLFHAHAMFAAVLADGYIAGGGRFPGDDPSLAETFA